MYDIHVDDRFTNSKGRTVRVAQLDIDGRVRYEFEDTAKSRWSDREAFLRRFTPIV